MIIEEADYTIRLIDMPGSVGAFISPNPDGTYNLFLNARFATDRNRQIDDYLHEWEHMENDDLYGEKSILLIERRQQHERR